jgi:YHS domain-containing protein
VFLRKDAGGTAVYEGRTYYFCCKDCLAKFNKEPKKYAGALKAAGEGCAHEKRTKEMKKTAGAADEAGCPAKKAGGCPMEKACKK